MEVDCVEYLEEEEVRVGWIDDLEEEVMVCCDEVWRRGRQRLSWVGDLEEGEILINQTEDLVEQKVMVQWVEEWDEEEEMENGGWSCDVENQKRKE